MLLSIFPQWDTIMVAELACKRMACDSIVVPTIKLYPIFPAITKYFILNYIDSQNYKSGYLQMFYIHIQPTISSTYSL